MVARPVRLLMAGNIGIRQESRRLVLACLLFAVVFICIYGRFYFTKRTSETRSATHLCLSKECSSRILDKSIKDTHASFGEFYSRTLKQTFLKADLTKSRDVVSNQVEITEEKYSNGTYKKRLPKALIIGVKKGGTKALLVFLRAHPSIRAGNKEVHFFDDEEHYRKGTGWYKDQMPESFSHEITLEKSPRYFVTGSVPRRVHQMSPDMKLILIFRNPVQRAISDYTHMRARKKKNIIGDDIEKMLWNNKTGTFNSSVTFVRNSLYVTFLKRWLKYFPMSQIHFVNGDDLIRHPGQEVVKVQKFLNLDVKITHEDFFFNKKKKFYCLKNRKTNHPSTKDIICLGKSKGRKHPPVSPRTLEAMKNFYRPYNEELYKMTGINFGW